MKEGSELHFGNRLNLVEIVTRTVAHVTLHHNYVSKAPTVMGRMSSPLLWYIGSAMGPARSKTWVAGKPFVWKLCGHTIRHQQGAQARVSLETRLVIAAACL